MSKPVLQAGHLDKSAHVNCRRIENRRTRKARVRMFTGRQDGDGAVKRQEKLIMHGGRPNGAGRPKDAISFKSRAVLEAAASGGEMPIASMLRVMRDEDAPDLRRDARAKAVAPNLYSKLSPISDEDGEETGPASEAETVEPARAEH